MRTFEIVAKIRADGAANLKNLNQILTDLDPKLRLSTAGLTSFGQVGIQVGSIARSLTSDIQALTSELTRFNLQLNQTESDLSSTAAKMNAYTTSIKNNTAALNQNAAAGRAAANPGQGGGGGGGGSFGSTIGGYAGFNMLGQSVGLGSAGMLVPLLMQGGPGAAAGVAASVINITKELFNLTREGGNAARELENLASRLGLTMEQAQQLSISAKLVGVNIGSLEMASRGLSSALDDPSGSGKKQVEILHRLGISTLEVTGAQKEMGGVLLEVLNRLSQIPNVAERVHESQVLLGKGSRVLQPMIEDLPRLKQLADELAGSLNSGVNKELLDADRNIREMDVAWEIFKKNLSAKIAPIVITIVRQITDTINGKTVSPGENSISGGDSLQDAPSAKDALFSQSLYSDLFKKGGKGIAQSGPGDYLALQSQQKMLASIAGGDALGKKVQEHYNHTRDGLEKQIALEKKAADEAREAAMQTGATLDFKIQKQQEMNAHLAKEASLRAELKGLTKTDKRPDEFARLLESLQDRKTDPYTEITGRVESEISSRKFTPAQADELRFQASMAGIRGMQGKAYRPFSETKGEKKFDEGYVNLGGYQELAGVQLPEGVDTQKEIATGLKEFGQQQLRNLKEAAGLGKSLDSIAMGEERSQIMRQFGRAQRVADLQNSGPGGEEEGANKAYSLRLDLARQLRDFDLQELDKNREQLTYADLLKEQAKIRAEFENQAAEAQLDKEMKLLELQKHRLEEFKTTFADLVMSSQGGASGLTQFLKGEGQKLEKTVLENLGGMFYSGGGSSMLGKLSLTSDTNSWAGKLLKGTPFGAHGSQETQLNTTATADNTRATGILTDAITRMSGRGGAGGGSGISGIPGLSAFGSDTNGLTGQGSLGGDSSDQWGSGEGYGGEGTYSGQGGTDGDFGGETSGGSGGGGGLAGLLSGGAGKAAGIAGLGAGAIFGAMSGIHSGGLRGGLQAGSAGLGALSGILALTLGTNPFTAPLAIAALGLGMIPGLLGDPKKNRATEIQKWIDQSRAIPLSQEGANYGSVDISGSNVDYSFQGQARTGAPRPVSIFVNAMDAKSFLDHADHITSVVQYAMENGHPINSSLRRTIGTG